MAGPLTWRNVDAPHIDIRGLAIAGGNITNSFDRMAQSLISREDTLRKEATDAAIAQGLATQDPEAVKALLAQGPGGIAGAGKRIDARAYMEALGVHQNRLIDTAAKNEEYLTQKAAGELGDEGQMYLAKLAMGDRAGAQEFAAAQAAANPLWGRVAYGFGKDGEAVFDNFDNRRMTGERDQETKRSHMANEADARARTGIAGAELGMRRQEHALRVAALQRAEKDRLAGEEAYGWGGRFAGALDPRFSPEDATKVLQKTERWKNAKPAERQILEASVGAAYGARTAMTEDAMATGGDGMPDYLRPNGPRVDRSMSVNGLNTLAAGARDQAKVATTAITQSHLAANPYLAVFQDVQGQKEQAPFADVVRYFEENTGIHAPSEDIRAAQARGLSTNEIMALAKTFGFKDPGWWHGGDAFVGGTREFGKRVDEYIEARGKGDIDKTSVELGTKVAPLAATQARLEKALARATRQAGANGGVPATTVQEIRQLQEELRQLSTPKP